MTLATTALPRRHRIGDVLRQAAWVLILVTLVGRMCFNESFMLSAPVNLNALLSDTPLDLDPVNRELLARSLFTSLLLAAGAIWAISLMMDEKPQLRFPIWGSAMVAFAAFAAVSTLRASDPAQAWAVWWDQVAILLAGYVFAQLATRQRLRQWVLILVALATTLAIKSLYQVFVEFPATRQLVAEHPEILTELSSDGDSVWAALYRLRLASATPSGFFAHPNVFASAVLVMLGAATGLTWALLSPWRSSDGARPPWRNALLAITCIATLLTGLMLLLTGSEAAAAVAAAVTVATGLLAFHRQRLARHPKLSGRLAISVAMGLMAGILLVAPSLSRVGPGGLGKSLATRHEYWSTSRTLITDGPLWGWGGGHFAGAYLQRKPISAEEDAQAPHNLTVHALVQFGLMGGGAYLMCLLIPLASVAQPPSPHADDPPLSRVAFFALCALPIAAMMASRTFLDGDVGGEILLFPVCLLGWLLIDRRAGVLRSDRLTVGLAAGVVAMAIHNLITLSLWQPGPALLFWGSAGLVLGGRQSIMTCPLRGPLRVAPAVGLMAMLIICATAALAPAARTTATWSRLCQAVMSDEPQAARLTLAQFARAGQPRDALCAARLTTAMMNDDAIDRATWSRLADIARRGATRAAAALPADSLVNLHAARVHWALGDGGEAIAYFERAVELDPTGMATRLMLAECYLLVEQIDDAAEQVDAILTIDAALPAASAYRLTPGQRERLDAIQAILP